MNINYNYKVQLLGYSVLFIRLFYLHTPSICFTTKTQCS